MTLHTIATRWLRLAQIYDAHGKYELAEALRVCAKELADVAGKESENENKKGNDNAR